MKQRKQDRVERRRPAVDLNMASDGKSLASAQKGLLAFLKRLFSGQR
jgi:hypothetical protein